MLHACFDARLKQVYEYTISLVHEKIFALVYRPGVVVVHNLTHTSTSFVAHMVGQHGAALPRDETQVEVSAHKCQYDQGVTLVYGSIALMIVALSSISYLSTDYVSDVLNSRIELPRSIRRTPLTPHPHVHAHWPRNLAETNRFWRAANCSHHVGPSFRNLPPRP